MNERDAIALELAELKEMRIEAQKVYWELILESRKRYTELQNRLRELDERDMYRPAPPPKVTQVERQPSGGLTVREMEVERVEKMRQTGKSLVPYEELTHAVEQFLKTVTEPVRLGVIRKSMEEKFGTNWTNFSNVMERVVSLSPYIQVDKSTKFFRYYHRTSL